MKKRFTLTALLLLLAILCVGCGQKEDTVQTAIKTFIETDLSKIKPLETESITKYNEISDNIKKMSREDILKAFDETIIPKYTEFLKGLDAINSKSSEVTKCIAIYKEGAKLQFDGLSNMKKAINDNDEDGVTAAINKIKEGNKKVVEYQSALEKLAKEHNITFKNKSGSTSATTASSNAETTKAK